MKHNLSRRSLILGLGTSGLLAGTASANSFWDAITGHVDDAKGRLFGEETFIDGEILKTGIFDETAVGQDAAHWAKGTATVETLDGKTYIQLGSDFNSGPLPDGYVYVSTTVDINDEADFWAAEQVELGPLQLGKGASYYEVPEGTVVNSVTVWCKRFGAYIGSADVK